MVGTNYPFATGYNLSLRIFLSRWRAALLLVVVLLSGSALLAQQRILVFSKTAGYRHASIKEGRNALAKMGAENGFAVDTTEDASVFSEKNLQRYATVVFLSTTGDVLDPVQQNAFERYIQAGGGYLGIHAATDTEYEWPWYGKLAGGYFKDHPSSPSNVQKGTYHIHDKTHASTAFLPEPWERTDEFYSFKNFNTDVKLLITLDEKTYVGGTMGDFHPAAWYHEYDGGRAFYTAMGHTPETFAEPLFLRHVREGLRWTMGGTLDYKRCRTPLMPEANRFTKVVVKEKLNEPMELSVLGDGRVLFIERHGAVQLYNSKTEELKQIATIPVSTKYKSAEGKESEAEDGLLGLTKDPNFSKNNWIYLYYSPAGDEAKNQLARFELKGDELLLDSKKVLLDIPVQREECCHTAGSMDWDAAGNLYLSTGDNSSPRADGYNPIDERPGRGPWDAQKSSGNTNDLRGKIIRIHPQADGSYTIPEGNLFKPGTPKTRPEIYTMGHRNPFRISVDKKTGYVYWGEVGPDAGKIDSLRGPMGYDEVGQARRAGNFGWPYFVGDNKAYHQYNYETKASGPLNDFAKPINRSPNNTGLNELPPAQKAFIWYPYDKSEEFPLVGTGGRNAMAGPVYHKADFKGAPNAFPDYYDGKLLIYEWMRGWIMAVTMDAEGNYVSMERFMPDHKFSNPMDLEFDANGSLWMLEYGTGWFQENDDARLVHIDYSATNRAPVVEASADRTAGAAPFTVKLSADGTKDYDGDALTYRWDITPAKGGKPVVHNVANPTVTLKKKGVYQAKLTVTDAAGVSKSRSLELVAGNEPPVLDLDLPGSNRSFFFPNQQIRYATKVTDREDGTLGKGIEPEEVAFTADYLAEGYDKEAIARGHRTADEAANLSPAQKLMAGSDCNSCHFANKKSVGPEYRLVAQRYRNQADAVKILTAKIINGGNGVWGDVAMAAHPQISQADAETMVNYILSLGDLKPRLDAAGTFEAAVPPGDKGEGVYVLRAAYRDHGAGDLPAQSAEKVYVLRNPSQSAHAGDAYEEVQKLTFGGSKPAIPQKSGAWVLFKDIDLTGIQQVDFAVIAPKAMLNANGGWLEVHVGKPDGPEIGRTPMIEPSEEASFAPNVVSAPLKPTNSVQDVYFVFKNDKVTAGQALFVLANLTFQTPEMLAAAAAAPPPAAVDADALKAYEGKYKFEGLPFEFIEVTVKDGKVHTVAGDQEGDLTPLPAQDRFDAAGQAFLQFLRDDKGTVTGLRLEASGFNFEGKKQ